MRDQSSKYYSDVWAGLLLGQGPIDVPTYQRDSTFHADDDTSQVYGGLDIMILCQRKSKRSDLPKPKSVMNVHALISKGFRLHGEWWFRYFTNATLSSHAIQSAFQNDTIDTCFISSTSILTAYRPPTHPLLTHTLPFEKVAYFELWSFTIIIG